LQKNEVARTFRAQVKFTTLDGNIASVDLAIGRTGTKKWPWTFWPTAAHRSVAEKVQRAATEANTKKHLQIKKKNIIISFTTHVCSKYRNALQITQTTTEMFPGKPNRPK